MPEPVPLTVVHTDPKPLNLDEAFRHALAFSPGRANGIVLSEDKLTASAEEEASYGQVSLDGSGITAGMQFHVVQPANDLYAEWGQVKGAFMTALKPHKNDIDAFEKLEGDISDLKTRRARVKESIEERANTDPSYVKIKTRFEKAKSRFEELSERQSHRQPTLAANSPFYWIGIFSIGAAEWLINYDTFLGFIGVPAIAAGSTIILGVLLAFSAHSHGVLFKQWGSRFGLHVPRIEQHSDYRLLALASFSLTLVLVAAGGSRYAAAMHAIGNQPQINLLGAEAIIVVNPVRDVLLSLLANIAAWAVGVFLSYLSHDKDHMFMDSAQEKRSADKAYEKARRPFALDMATEEAKIEREINEKENSAAARSNDVKEQRQMLLQVLEHEETIKNAILGAVRKSAEAYKSKLSATALTSKDKLVITRDGVPISPYEYKAKPIEISAALLTKSFA